MCLDQFRDIILTYSCLFPGMSWELLSSLAGQVLFSVSWEAACSASRLQILFPIGWYEQHILYSHYALALFIGQPAVLFTPVSLHFGKMKLCSFSSQPESRKLYLQRCCVTLSYLLMPKRAGEVCKPESPCRLRQLLQDAAV